MTTTTVTDLASFTVATNFEQLPPEVVHESKRTLLDSIGCALAGVGFPKANAAVKFARSMSGPDDTATILGTTQRGSAVAAAFANAELINTLDMDCVLPPGHVAPAVLASILAVAEEKHCDGKAVLEAIAVSHEMSNRFGKAMDNLRDTKEGESRPPRVFGYTSPVFGAAAAIGKLKGHDAEVIAHALGIAACISPVNSMMTWIHHAPATTIKYTMMGALSQAAFTAAAMAEYGHRGDVQVLDDREYGYPRFIGTDKWEPQRITEGLGTQWRFPAETSYKPYPHCRVFNALQDCVIGLVTDHAIAPDEIDAIRIYVEAFAEKPVWVTRSIEDVHDAQFSMYHGIAVAAHRVPPGRDWLDPAFIRSASVLALMHKVSSAPHPDYVKLLTGNAASRPARVEIDARGQTFTAEKRYPKGSRSPEPDTWMTDQELVAKFLHNAKSVVPDDRARRIADTVMGLEQVTDMAAIVRLAAGAQTN